MNSDMQSLRPGTVVQGPRRSYKIIKKLGQGGFGITYLVEGEVKIDNITATVRFALKEHFISSLSSREAATQHVVFSDPVANEVLGSMQSFSKEARRLQDLNFTHDNVVKINEVFEANNTAYYVMEYLDGETLDDFIKREGPLTFEQTAYFVRPIAEAVAELHARHLTHYDIKPANIILNRDSATGAVRPVLIDFGLSKHYDSSGRATSTRSQGGYSPGYSPVEQYAGIRTFTPQADVYSLAATLWYCLKGTDPAEAVAGPVNTIDEDLGGVASPKVVEAMRHALAILSNQRTPDAGAFVSEVFGGAPVVQTKVTMQRKAPEPYRPLRSDNATVSIQSKPQGKAGRAEATKNSKKTWLFSVILVLIVLVVVGILTSGPDKIIPELRYADETIDYGRTTYNAFDLCAVRDGKVRFFSIDEWNAVPDSEKSKYTKKGVVVKGGSVPAGEDAVFIEPNPTAGYASDFLVELHHSGRAMTWDEAMHTYGSRLPDIYQGYHMAKNYEKIYAAIKAFGGDPLWAYWTKTEYDSSYAWNVRLNYGLVGNLGKTYTYRVRAVAPVPVASAK